MDQSQEPERAYDLAEIYRVGRAHGTGELIDLPDIPAAEMEQISRLMLSLAHLREAEQKVSEASQRYMKLGEQEMKALHYLIVAKRKGEVVTPGALAQFLQISASSTTKLLNRLEKGEHITRRMHPRDRRAFIIEITPVTEASAKQTVGRHQARRFYSAARLTSDEREVVIRFLDDMTAEISLANAPWLSEAEASA